MKGIVVKVTLKGGSKFIGVVVKEATEHLHVKVGRLTIKVSKSADIVIVNL